MGGNRCQMVERGCVSPTVSPNRLRTPGGPTRTTRWVDKATHMGGSVIALEVPVSRYWVRSIFCLKQQTEHRDGDVAPVAVPLTAYCPRDSGFVPLRDDCLPLAMHGGDRQQPV